MTAHTILLYAIVAASCVLLGMLLTRIGERADHEGREGLANACAYASIAVVCVWIFATVLFLLWMLLAQVAPLQQVPS